MLSQDWLPYMKLVMEHGKPGDVYEVMHIDLRPGSASPLRGSCYVKTEVGHRSCSLFNADTTGLKLPPFRI